MMGRIFILILIIVCLNEIKVCVATAACTKYQDQLVVNGCQNNSRGAAPKLYLDTGTNPSFQYIPCKCEIYVAGFSTTITLNSDYTIEQSNHNLEIGDVVLNSTIKNGSLTISDKTELWITPGSSGGFCLTMSANNNITVKCFKQNYQIKNVTSPATPVQLSTVRAQSKVVTKATDIVTGQSKAVTEATARVTVTESIQSLDDTKVDIIGPVAGGISGLVLTVIVILIVVYFKRRKNVVKEENKESQHSQEEEDDYTTENPMYEKADDDDNPVLSKNHVMMHIDENNDNEGEYNYVTNVDEPSTANKKMKQADLKKFITVNKKPRKKNETSTTRMHEKQDNQDLPEYSIVNKKTTEQKLSPKSDVYDRTDDHQLVAGSDEYHRLDEFTGEEKTYDSVKKSVQTSLDAHDHYDVSCRKT